MIFESLLFELAQSPLDELILQVVHEQLVQTFSLLLERVRLFIKLSKDAQVHHVWLCILDFLFVRRLVQALAEGVKVVSTLLH